MLVIFLTFMLLLPLSMHGLLQVNDSTYDRHSKRQRRQPLLNKFHL